MEIFGSVIIQLCQVIYFGLNLATYSITFVYTKNQQKTAPLKTRFHKGDCDEKNHSLLQLHFAKYFFPFQVIFFKPLIVLFKQFQYI